MRALAAAILASTLLVGCQSPAATPTPTPSYSCTPEAGGTPAPCTRAEFEQMQKMDALYAEAETVNAAFRAEMERHYRMGGATELSPVFLETTAGPAREALLEFQREMHAAKRKSVGGEIKIVWVKRNAGESMQGSDVSLRVCTDGTSLKSYEDGEYLGPGLKVLDVMYFTTIDGKLKITFNTAEEDPECSDA